MLKAEDVFAAPTEDNKKLFADGVAYYLNCIATALGGRNNRGMKAIAGLDPKTAGMVRELLNNHVDPLLVVLGNPRTVPQAMVQELTDRGGKLNAWLQANAPPPAAAGS